MLRIALVALSSTPPYGNNLRGPLRALADLGESRHYEPSLYPGFLPTGGAAPAPLPEALLRAVAVFRPHLVVCLGGALYVPPLLRGLLPQRCALIGVALSDPQALAASLVIAPGFDFFYTQDEGSVPVYRQHGLAARYLPLAVDTSAFVPMNSPALWDVLYVGKWTAYREAILAQLASRFDVRIVAYRHESRWSLPVVPQLDDEALLCGALNAARVVLDPCLVDDIPGPAPLYRITPRSFMAAACAVPALVEAQCPLGGLFAPGEEIATFDGTPEGAMAAVARLLGDEARRQAMGRAALHRVRAEHSWDRRARQILEDLLNAFPRFASLREGAPLP